MACSKEIRPLIEMETSYGTILIEVYADKAPISAANFLRYVDENKLDDAVFYRSVKPENQPSSLFKIQVLQGGLFHDNHPDMMDPIAHEATNLTGILHKRGVVSLARLEPGTASSEFFICLRDEPELDFNGNRNPDKQGFAAFGRVIKGMSVVEKIHELPDTNQFFIHPVKILSVKRINTINN